MRVVVMVDTQLPIACSPRPQLGGSEGGSVGGHLASHSLQPQAPAGG